MTSLAPAEPPGVTAPQASFRDPAGVLFSRAGRLFILVRFPIPHPPYFFDRARRAFSLRDSPVRGCPDSLALVDLTVGGLRHTLERAARWDQTPILLTSDHALRAARAFDGKPDPRVPFLLELPRQREAVPYSLPFNTRVGGDLLPAIAAAQLSTPAQVAAWLEHPAPGEHPRARRGPSAPLVRPSPDTGVRQPGLHRGARPECPAAAAA